MRAKAPAGLFATGFIGTPSVSGAAEAVYQHLEKNLELAARIYDFLRCQSSPNSEVVNDQFLQFSLNTNPSQKQ